MACGLREQSVFSVICACECGRTFTEFNQTAPVGMPNTAYQISPEVKINMDGKVEDKKSKSFAMSICANQFNPGDYYIHRDVYRRKHFITKIRVGCVSSI
jgi:hypothetical protein